MTPARLEHGGRVDRSRTIQVWFDGRLVGGYPGDTLASALLASGRVLLARSFKYHRPRGIFAAGVEEPNVLVHIRDGARQEPNAQATTVEAFDGLAAKSQNAWPTLQFDFGMVSSWLSPFLGAGFYYKTFIGPFRGTRFWMTCEGFIRRAAGLGRAITLDDPDRYEKANAFCDVLVVGSGPAGLSAALAAARSGLDVVLADQDFLLGGALLSEPVGGRSDAWLAEMLVALKALPNVRIMSRTTVFGAYDSDVFGMIERVADHLPIPEPGAVRQRYWVLRCRRAILATGAIERPIVFAGNDIPGVMLASAARTYLNRFAVLVGRRVVMMTNNDSAHETAITLAQSGANVVLCDLRRELPEDVTRSARGAGVDLRMGWGILSTRGRHRVTGVLTAPVDQSGSARSGGERLACDIVTVSGGWTPALNLWSQRYGHPLHDEGLDAFVPTPGANRSILCVGSMNGSTTTARCIEEGWATGLAAAKALGAEPASSKLPVLDTPCYDWARDHLPITIVTGSGDRKLGKAFVDLQHDVKLDDIDQAYLEGYQSVEHLKRYTTLGMAMDQGRTSNLNALGRLANLQSLPAGKVGTTTFRPPYTPVAIGAVVGHEHGQHFRPTRLSPIHDWHLANGAVMTEAGAWLRPWYYPKPGEDLQSAYTREAAHVRSLVGMVDVSTLGKIAVQGPDAAEFLDRVYVNGFRSLNVGRIRYGVMLRDDGFVFDDGTTARLSETDYFMTTTTANADKVLATAEKLLHTAWSDLRVHVTSLTDQWAVIAVAGPRSREVLSKLVETDISSEALPNNSLVLSRIDGVACRLHRMSYSGELAYELYIPGKSALRLWQTLYEAGREFGIIPFGTEAIGTLRIEKGHVAGPELDGRMTLGDLGLEGMASRTKPFVGSILRNRPALRDPDRPVLVGLRIEGPKAAASGSLLFARAGPDTGHGEGWVSSATWSPALGCNIALGFLARGAARYGEMIRVIDFLGGRTIEAEVVSHRFFDSSGERQNA